MIMPRVRDSALDIEGIKDPQVIDLLDAALRNPALLRPGRRSPDIESVQRPESRWSLSLPLPSDMDSIIRRMVIQALGQTEDARVVGPVRRRFEDPNQDVRLAAIRVLGK
jgi:HEAT repeat protein